MEKTKKIRGTVKVGQIGTNNLNVQSNKYIKNGRGRTTFSFCVR
jgi:hypothetical protein